MVKEFNSIEQIEKYYDKNTNTYVFMENKYCFDVHLHFNLCVSANIIAQDIKAWNIEAYNIKGLNIEAFNVNARNIDAWNIDAWNIDAEDIQSQDIHVGDIKVRDINARDITALDLKARNIKAQDIKAYNIEAQDIIYYAVCFAYENIKCKSIKGRRYNAKKFVLDGKIEVENGKTNNKRQSN